PANVVQLGPESLSLLTVAPNTTAQVGGAMYFLGGDGTGAPGLWKTDGTDAGTTAVSAPGLSGLNINGRARGAGPVYISATSTSDPTNVNVYKLDSSAAGGVAPVTSFTGQGGSIDLRAVGNELVFTVTALSKTTRTSTQSVYVSDGTPAGTVQVASFA